MTPGKDRNMDAARIKKIRDSKERARQRQWQNYQSTGDDNYYRKMNGYEDIVTICNQALSAAEDHQKAQNLKFDIIDFAKEAADLIHHDPNIDADIKNLLKNIMATAERYGWQNKWE